MKKRVLLISGIGIIIILAVVFQVNKSYVEKYNETFPEEYIHENYPNAEIISNHSEGDIIINAHSEKYLCYDSEKQFAFIQEFAYRGTPAKLAADNKNYRSYQSMMNHRESFDRCINSIPEYYGGEFFTRYNPDNISGILVFAHLKDIDLLPNLIDGLNNAIWEERTSNDFYICYSIYFCSDGIYDKFKNFDYESIVRTEEYMYYFSGQVGMETAELMSDKEFIMTGEYGMEYFTGKVPSETDILFIKGELNTTKLKIKLYCEKQ